MKKNKIIWIILTFVILIFTIFIGVSFAYIKLVKIQKGTEKIAATCLNITFEEDTDSTINLVRSIPITDADGLASTPYTFKVTNNCSTSVQYAVNLEFLTDLADEFSLQPEYTKISLDGSTIKFLSEYDDTETTVSGGYSAKELINSTLKGNTSVSYELRLWIGEDTTKEQGSHKTFEAKITINNATDKSLYLANYIKKLAETDTTNLVYDETSDNNLRYIGKDPSNYLCFDEDCSNGKWRIIGVMNNVTTSIGIKTSLVKVIRAERLTNSTFDDYYQNNWINSTLQNNLNNGSYYSILKYYNNLLETVKWSLGGAASYTSSDNGLASNWYTYERGTTVYDGNNSIRPTTWTGKIALMYPSDYGFATSGGSTTDRATCLAKELYNWDSSNYSDCRKNDYLYNSSYAQWTLTPSSSNGSYVMRISTSGYIGISGSSSSYAISPTFYLIPNIKIVSGDGTSDNPWIISEI
jgi:hypothetical protein